MQKEKHQPPNKRAAKILRAVMLLLLVGGTVNMHTRVTTLTVPSDEETTTTKTASASTGAGTKNHAHFPLILRPERETTQLDPISLPESEGKFLEDMCATWKGTKGGPLDFSCKIEWDEWVLANALVQQGDVVIEYGARFGTTSCILSRAVGRQRGHVVSVEPDYRVHGHLLRNLYDHQCSAVHAVLGTVSATPQMMPDFGSAANGYGVQTSSKSETITGGRKREELPFIQWQAIEEVIEEKFNVALIDCEGCLSAVNASGLLQQVDLVMMEEDGADVDYTGTWHTQLRKDFDCIWYTKDTVDPTRKEWSRNLRHSAWLRPGSNRSYVSCEEHRDKMGLSPTELTCAQCPVAAIS